MATNDKLRNRVEEKHFLILILFNLWILCDLCGK
jgi:hypothetical protein